MINIYSKGQKLYAFWDEPYFSLDSSATRWYETDLLTTSQNFLTDTAGSLAKKKIFGSLFFNCRHN